MLDFRPVNGSGSRQLLCQLPNTLPSPTQQLRVPLAFLFPRCKAGDREMAIKIVHCTLIASSILAVKPFESTASTTRRSLLPTGRSTLLFRLLPLM